MAPRIEQAPLYSFGLTDPGRSREQNEDAFFASDEQGLFVVSDGMGGQQAGALASAMTVQALPLMLPGISENRASGAEGISPVEVALGLVRAIERINKMLLEKTEGHPEVRGLGATVVSAMNAGEGILAIANLGDSRAYLLRGRILERLTTDHTLAGVLLASGRITRKQFSRHPSRHVLTRHIGSENGLGADTGLLGMRLGDRILLCSDGLTEMLNDAKIGSILLSNPSPEAACRSLVKHANKAGGSDNITALVVDVGQQDSAKTGNGRRVIVRRMIGRSLSHVLRLTQDEE